MKKELIAELLFDGVPITNLNFFLLKPESFEYKLMQAKLNK